MEYLWVICYFLLYTYFENTNAVKLERWNKMKNLDKNPCNEEVDSSQLCVISSHTSTSKTYQLCSYMYFVTLQHTG